MKSIIWVCNLARAASWHRLLTWTYKYLNCLKLISIVSIAGNNDYTFTIPEYDLQKHYLGSDGYPLRFGLNGSGR